MKEYVYLGICYYYFDVCFRFLIIISFIWYLIMSFLLIGLSYLWDFLELIGVFLEDLF